LILFHSATSSALLSAAHFSIARPVLPRGSDPIRTSSVLHAAAGNTYVPLMATEPDNLVPEHLRAIRGDVTLLRDGQGEIALRMGSLEQQVVGLRRDFADLRGDFVRLEQGMDRLDQRVERIERRLDLVDAP
jgi:hypothetical protein